MMRYQQLHKRRGFTLIEFMIASALGLVVLAIVGSLYGYTKRLNQVAENRLVVHQNLRIISDLIMRDARQAGNFGCLSLGQLYSADEEFEFSDKFKVDYNDKNIQYLKGLKGSGEKNQFIVGKQSGDLPTNLGIRWIDAKNLPLAEEAQEGDFTPVGKALVFLYGEGSTSISNIIAPGGFGASKQSITVESNDQGSTSAPVIRDTVTNKGYLVLASCRAMGVFQAPDTSTVSETGTTIPIPYQLSIANVSTRLTETTALGAIPANIYIAEQLELMRYIVVAYVVGKTKSSGDVTGLYRFELAADGKWRGPELLMTHVNSMAVQFFYPSDKNSKKEEVPCQSISEETDSEKALTMINRYKIISNNTDQEGVRHFKVAGKDYYVSPSLIRIALTYDYPQVGAKKLNFQSGDNGSLFIMQAAIRGGNSCANRVINEIDNSGTGK